MKSNNEKKSNERDTGTDFSIFPLLTHLFRKIWIILAVGALIAALSFFAVKTFVRPTYRSYFTAYINNQHASVSKDMLTASDVNASKELVLTYSTILTSNSIVSSADEVLGGNYSVKQLKKMIGTQVTDDTEIIQVFVVATSPEESYKIASAVAGVSPKIMADIVEGSSMKIVEYPQIPDSIYKPNYIKYTLLGFGIGMLLTIIVLSVRFIRNDTIKDEKEIEAMLSVPVLGVIPDSNHASNDKSNYYYGYYYEEKSKGENDSEKA